jgi:protein required for attachment to host cells
MANFSVTWIAVVGAHKAYFFEKTTKENLSLVKEITADLDEEHEKPGRTFNSVGSVRHAIEPHTDRREVERQDFSTKVLENLSDGLNHNKFAKLVLIADPKMLGIINNSLDKNLASKLQKSFPKNLAEMEINEIREHICHLQF